MITFLYALKMREDFREIFAAYIQKCPPKNPEIAIYKLNHHKRRVTISEKRTINYLRETQILTTTKSLKSKENTNLQQFIAKDRAGKKLLSC